MPTIASAGITNTSSANQDPVCPPTHPITEDHGPSVEKIQMKTVDASTSEVTTGRKKIDRNSLEPRNARRVSSARPIAAMIVPGTVMTVYNTVTLSEDQKTGSSQSRVKLSKPVNVGESISE